MSKDLYFDNVDFSEIQVTEEIDYSYDEEEEEDGETNYIDNETTEEIDFDSLTL